MLPSLKSEFSQVYLQKSNWLKLAEWGQGAGEQGAGEQGAGEQGAGGQGGKEDKE